MTDKTDKSSRGTESHARPTARDVPLTRGAGSDSEPAPRGQRPNQLPRDPTYEAELAKVELAVLRDPERRDGPSTKQGGRGHELALSQPPESVTPESPGTRASRASSPAIGGQPPSSSGRSVASGTLLSVGAVDPRGRTEPTLETPRMFFSQPEAAGEIYFKPGKIPAVTVHQTLETETVKLSESIDPRRAKTLPRIDRTALARFAEAEGTPESESPLAVSRPASDLDPAEGSSRKWDAVDYEAASSLGENDGQIHASLSAFRDQGEPSFSMDGVPTRAEPLAARRVSDVPTSLPAPDTSAMPTHRDLPVHRIEASRPPPPPPSAPNSVPIAARRQPIESVVPGSEAPSPTTASIAAEDPQPRRAGASYAAFFLALLVAVGFGMWLTRATRATDTREAAPDEPSPEVATKRNPALVAPGTPPGAVITPSPSPPPTSAGASSPAEPRNASPGTGQLAPTTPALPAVPRKSPPSKPPRETIF